MLNKLKNFKKTNDTKGFTIIEVMIVLAIAGMILLIVLLAVPALQRNSRNTAIKSDASSVAGGIGEFASNNNGAQPAAGGKSTYATGVISLNNATGTASTVKVQASDVVTFGAATTAKVTPQPGTIYIDFGAKCGVTTGTGSTPVAQARATAIIYSIEASGSIVAECLDS